MYRTWQAWSWRESLDSTGSRAPIRIPEHSTRLWVPWLLAPQRHHCFMIERIDTNARSSKIVRHGGVIYLTGQVAEGETIEVQTQDCLAKVDALLKRAGSTRENLLQVTIWLADMADFAAMNEIWNAWVPEGHAPARACGEVKLARDELKIEILAIAADS